MSAESEFRSNPCNMFVNDGNFPHRWRGDLGQRDEVIPKNSENTIDRACE